jgi:hypothetical protein
VRSAHLLHRNDLTAENTEDTERENREMNTGRCKCQLSTVNYQLSTVNCQLSTVNYQLSTVNCQLSTINCQLSTVNCQLSTSMLLTFLQNLSLVINFQTSIRKIAFCQTAHQPDTAKIIINERNASAIKFHRDNLTRHKIPLWIHFHI